MNPSDILLKTEAHPTTNRRHPTKLDMGVSLNTERLYQLADLLDRLDEKHFDQGVTIKNAGAPSLDPDRILAEAARHNTVAGTTGWTYLLFQPLNDRPARNLSNYGEFTYAAQQLLGLNYDQMEKAFFCSVPARQTYHAGRHTARAAAVMLRHLAQTGQVDWNTQCRCISCRIRRQAREQNVRTDQLTIPKNCRPEVFPDLGELTEQIKKQYDPFDHSGISRIITRWIVSRNAARGPDCICSFCSHAQSYPKYAGVEEC